MYSMTRFHHYIEALVGAVLFILVLDRQRYRFRVFCSYLAVAVAFGMSVVLLKDAYLFVACALIIAASNLDVDDFVRYDLKLRIVILVIVVGLCKAGYLDNYSAIINGTYKQALGFTHPNTLAAVIITILVEWIYVRYEDLGLIDYIAILLAVYWLQSVAASRSAIYTFILVLVIVVITKCRPKIWDALMVRIICCWLPIIATVFSYVLVWLYYKRTSIGVRLDQLLTHRPENSLLVIQEYGFSLFGQFILTKSTRNSATSTATLWTVDMSYVAIPVRYGIVLFIVLLVGYYLANRRAIAAGRYNLVIAMAFFVLYGIGETALYRIQYNFTLLALVAAASGLMTASSTTNKLQGATRI